MRCAGIGGAEALVRRVLGCQGNRVAHFQAHVLHCDAGEHGDAHVQSQGGVEGNGQVHEAKRDCSGERDGDGWSD